MRSFILAAAYAATFLIAPPSAESFSLTPSTTARNSRPRSATIAFMADAEGDANELIGRRITVTGDVNGGYVRTCIINEASKFRGLIGTMSPPDDDSDTAEIYIEGKRKMVEGFIRYCDKGSKKVGLSQKLAVKEVQEEIPTGLYDGFYAKNH